jgi:hypothetical protein
LDIALSVGVEISPSISPEARILLVVAVPEDDGRRGSGEVVEDKDEGGGRGNGGVEEGHTAEKRR